MLWTDRTQSGSIPPARMTLHSTALPRGWTMRGYSNASLRVLVVDDNVDTASMLALMLRSWGHEAVVTHDGLAALARAVDFRPDAVLLDIGLPLLDGFE